MLLYPSLHCAITVRLSAVTGDDVTVHDNMLSPLQVGYAAAILRDVLYSVAEGANRCSVVSSKAA
jgi:hypothetical protein